MIITAGGLKVTLGLVQIINEKAEKRQGSWLASAAVTGDIKAAELLGRPPLRPPPLSQEVGPSPSSSR